MTATTIRYVTGDACRPEGTGRRLICHVCNDIGGWGRGFVVALSKRWPGPEAAYRAWYRDGRATDPLRGSDVPFALGQILPVVVDDGLAVVNMVAQHDVRPTGGVPPIRYGALTGCLEQVAAVAVETGASVHAPRFGAGLAGGDWDRIEAIIDQTLCSAGVEVTIYDLPPR